jgi:hypothetical protein
VAKDEAAVSEARRLAVSAVEQFATEASPLEVERLQRLKRDYPFFANNVLRVATKAGTVVPFRLNRAQLYAHARMEAQRQRTGMVRMMVVKARRVGFSTYMQGRFYHKLWRTKNPLRAYILTHEQPATDTLFGMARRFYANHDPSIARPELATGNAKELRFADSEGGYQVATAGTKETGRSATFHLFHGSEVAFWPNATDHVAASMQAVGSMPGTEIVLESSANGIGNLFYHMCQAALRGESEYELIFIPWFWDDDCRAPCPPAEEWDPSEDWYEYAKLYSLDWEQLYWAYLKNRELALTISATYDKPCWKFRQEYPANVDEAFQSSGLSFIPALQVLMARRNNVVGHGPVILGVDPARSGDKVGIIDRCGRRMGQRIAQRMDPGGSVTYVAAQIMAIIRQIKPDMVNIDVGSNGAGVYDILCDNGFGDITNAVNFGSNPVGTGPTGDDIYFNRRAEMYDEMRQWFDQEANVQIPDDDGLQGDICGAEWGPGKTRYNTSNELILEEKDEIKKRLGASPDLGDAAALTFAVPYSSTATASQTNQPRRGKNRRTGY